MTDVEKDERRNRTVSWPPRIDEMAIEQAVAAGYYPEKTRGGVSAYLASLVLKAAGGDTRSPIKQHIGQISAVKTALKKK